MGEMMNARIAEILHLRLYGKLSDDEAVTALVRAGKSKRAARDMLRFQDALFVNDCIVVDEQGRELK